MTELLYGPELKWAKCKNWTKVEWKRLTEFNKIDIWLLSHCKKGVWCRSGSTGWNVAYYFEDPNEAVLFKLVWG